MPILHAMIISIFQGFPWFSGPGRIPGRRNGFVIAAPLEKAYLLASLPCWIQT
jgi:hypothetical protein